MKVFISLIFIIVGPLNGGPRLGIDAPQARHHAKRSIQRHLEAALRDATEDALMGSIYKCRSSCLG
jgi:hypothetical protein